MNKILKFLLVMIVGLIPLYSFSGTSKIEPYPITYWGINTFLSNSVYFYFPSYNYNIIDMNTNNINNINSMNIVNNFSLRSLSNYTNIFDQVEQSEGPSNLVEVLNGGRKIRITFANAAEPGEGILLAGVTTNLFPTNIFYLTDVYSNASFTTPPCIVMSWAPTQSVDVLAQPEIIEVQTNKFSWRVRSSGGINTNAWIATFIAVDSKLLSGGGIGNAEKLNNHGSGNGTNDIPINNGILNDCLNADMLDSKHDWEYTINKVNDYASANHVVDSTDYGKNLVFETVTPATNICILPNGTSTLLGLTISFSRIGTGALKITQQPNDIILDSTNSIISSVTTETYASIQLILVKTNKWIAKSVVGTWKSEYE